MFKTQEYVLAVLNMPQIQEVVVPCLRKFHVVGILTDSIKEFKTLCQTLCQETDIMLYEYGSLCEIDKKIIVADTYWVNSLRSAFETLMAKYGKQLGDDYIYYSMLQGKINTNDIFELVEEDEARFQNVMRVIAGNRKIVVIHGNCQAHTISSMLAANEEFTEKYLTIEMPRIWEDNQRPVMEQMLKSGVFCMADYLFTQEVSRENRFWDKYASDFLKSLVPQHCEVIMISNLFFLGYFPQYWKMKHMPGFNFFRGKLLDATEYTDINVLRMILEDKSDEEILATISHLQYYTCGQTVSAIEKELGEFKKREEEQGIEIKMNDYLFDNYDKFLLFATSNHPTRKVMMELTRRILQRLNIRDLQINCADDEIQEPMPSEWRYLIYPSVLHNLGIDRIMEYSFRAIFKKTELECIKQEIGGLSGRIEYSPIENSEWYLVEVKGGFETYMKVYICCMRAAVMLL